MGAMSDLAKLDTESSEAPQTTLVAASSRRSEPISPRLRLLRTPSAEGIGRIFLLEKSEIFIGRGAQEVEVRLEDDGISRKHAKLIAQPDGQYRLVDLGSRNGTFVNGRRIEEAVLNDGDRIQMGTLTSLKFTLSDEGEGGVVQALAAARVATWNWDVVAGQIVWSENVETMLGLNLPGRCESPRDFCRLIHSDDRKRAIEALELALAHGNRYELECRLPAGERWVAFQGEVLRDQAGLTLCVAGTVMDITLRVRAEEELRRQAMLFDHLYDAVIVTDLEGRVLDWNPSAQRTFGFSKVEVLARPPPSVLRPSESLAKQIAAAMDRDGRWTGELALKTKAGADCVCEAVMVPLRDGQGRSVGQVSVYRDLSERKQMQAKLLFSDRMASVGTLAAGVAHEINNPLAFIKANLIFLTDELARLGSELAAGRLTELSDALRDTVQGAARIGEIVRDLKTFSKGEEPTPNAPVDVQRVVQFVAKMAENEIRHRARLVLDFPESLWVLGNESRLSQVFLNLLVNAAQAMREGEASSNEVRITGRNVEGGKVEIEVRDTGSGISPEIKDRIFNPFFTTKGIGGGTGLGLSVSHAIVTSMGGEISVQSEVGKGTTFRLLVPSAQAPSPVVVVPEPVRAPRAQRARVLVIDDERLVATAIQRLLANVYEVRTSPSGTEAISMFDGGQRFDVILCDLMMPDITGMDLYETLCRSFPDQAKRMVFMTGGAFTDRASSFLGEVSNPSLRKPFDRSGLLGAIDQALAATGAVAVP